VATPPLVSLLHLFGTPRPLDSVDSYFPPASEVRGIVRRLVRLGFLIPFRRSAANEMLSVWRESFAAAYFHSMTCDVVYAATPRKKEAYFLDRLALAPQPAPYKSYRGAQRIRLGKPGLAAAALPIGETLQLRRTVRKFGRRPMGFDDFSLLLGGTWGQTGWLDAGLLGRLVGKTSPSAGARHPIECYVLVWNVEGIPPGLYHYGVQNDTLERLRRGDFRDEAVRFASGQSWIRRASFLCVLTAVVGRVFWKYGSSDAYRLFFLDAGHLAQTFALLATARGLGAFTTAALQETRIQKFLGIDGVREFPLYLCGAGTPSA
jgi:SagB-type dehydrogenase family enzyme